MAGYKGYLYSKLGAVGSKSEGPIYYLQHFESNKDYQVKKHTALWQSDPILHPFLDKKVTIDGDLVPEAWIDYRTISE